MQRGAPVISTAKVDETFNAWWSIYGRTPDTVERALAKTRAQIAGPMPPGYVPPPWRTSAPSAAPEGAPGGAVDLTGLTQGEAVNKVGIINHLGDTEVRLRGAASTGSAILRTLPFNTLLQVLRARDDGWSFVSTRDGQLGYVASSYVYTHLPEPTSRLHLVESGLEGTAIAIAEQYYWQESYDWGRDLRFYVNVLAYANKKQVRGATDWSDVQFQADNLIWVPGRAYADSLVGVVDSGSISYAVVSAIERAFLRFAQFLEDVADAISRSFDYMGPAIARHVEAALVDTLKSLALLAVGAIAILAVSTAVGAAIGALGGGVGAAPGAAAGFQVGLALIDWLGLGMLVAWIAQSIEQVGSAFARFIATVWSADGDAAVVDRAAYEFADAIGTLLEVLLQAVLMYVSAKGIGALVEATAGTPFGRTLAEKPFMRWMEENRVKYRSKWEGPLKPPEVVLRRLYRGVEIVQRTPKGKLKSLGEFDGIDMNRKTFIENKSARGLQQTNRANPTTTPADWAQKQIVDKTNVRIQNLSTATGTRTTPLGSTQIPSLADIQGFRALQFRIDADTPALRSAVTAAISTLAAQHPGWTFKATFGQNLLLPPVPGVSDDN